MKHTPLTAAKACRALLGDTIATTWERYHSSEWKANAYVAAKIVQEQCNGPLKDVPVSFREAADAVAEIMPELFAEYWMNLPRVT